MLVYVIVQLLQAAYVPLRDVDSYHYLSVIQGMMQPTTLFEWLISKGLYPCINLGCGLLTVYVIHSILRRYGLYGHIATALFVLDPFFVFNDSISLIDKNSIYMLGFVLCIYVSYIVKDNTAQMIWHSLILACVSLLWEGWYVMFLILVLYHAIIRFKTMDTATGYMLAGSFIILCAYIVYTKRNLLTWNVMELRPAFMFVSPMYFVYLMTCIILGIAIYKGIISIDRPLMLAACTTLSFLCIFRLHTFFLPVFYAVVFVRCMQALEQTNMRPALVTLFIGMIVLSMPMIFTKSRVEPWMIEKSVEYSQSDKTCSNNDWGPGHILAYYSYPKQVRCKGHPNAGCDMNLSRCFMLYPT